MGASYKDQIVVDQFNKDFTYVSDKHQFRTNEDYHLPDECTGPVKDDCDGYTLALLYRLVGCDVDRFWQAINDGTAEVWHVHSDPDGDGQWVGHAMLKWQGEWIDNIYPYFRSIPKHELCFRYYEKDLKAKFKGEMTLRERTKRATHKVHDVKKTAKDNKAILLVGALVVIGGIVFMLAG